MNGRTPLWTTNLIGRAPFDIFVCLVVGYIFKQVLFGISTQINSSGSFDIHCINYKDKNNNETIPKLPRQSSRIFKGSAVMFQ